MISDSNEQCWRAGAESRAILEGAGAINPIEEGAGAGAGKPL